ncbi:MAG: Gfo/Idh/MocA family oxidoreductase [Bacteroidota bacterium]
MNRKIRMGMVGGGLDAFIGAVHRKAAALDGEIELVCGAFSSKPDKSKATGEALYLPANRVYDSFATMIQSEKELPEGEKMDFVSIVTPNHLHFEPARMALENGFHVMIDKPIAYSLDEAQQLQTMVDNTGLLLGLTHTYTGYPMVKEARQIISSGQLGTIRKVFVEYPQGWLSTPLEQSGQKQADWRTDPARSGKSGCMGDIGTHAANLAEYITGLKISQLCADLNTVIEGRMLDDDGAILLRFDNGASGVLIATQVAAGEENPLRIRVYGEKGGLDWLQEEPNTLTLKWLDKPREVLRTGANYAHLSSYALHNARLPSGHPEGYLEAFANIYRNFALSLRAIQNGQTPSPEMLDFPKVDEGVSGMAFIDKVIESSQSDQKWTSM